MATKKIAKIVEKKISDDIMTDGLHTYHKQANGKYWQVGSPTILSLDMWFALGVNLKVVGD